MVSGAVFEQASMRQAWPPTTTMTTTTTKTTTRGPTTRPPLAIFYNMSPLEMQPVRFDKFNQICFNFKFKSGVDFNKIRLAI
jgi:hypothetical protein